MSSIHPLAPFAKAPLLFLISAFLMLLPLSTDLYLASLPGLGDAFAVPPATVQMTLSLFVIGFGGAQLLVGPLSDRYGRRPVVLAGLALYFAASLACLLAPSISVLIAGRFLQALGCCAAVVIGRALVRDAFAPEHGAGVLARASTWLSLGPLLGPILGSYLQVSYGWRAAFAALALVSGTLLVLTALRLPETNLQRDRRATELSGLYANYRLVLGSRSFWAHALPGALSYGAIFSFISGSSFVLIRVLQVPTAWFGYCFAFGVSGYMAGTLVCRRLLPVIGTRNTFRLGAVLALLTGASFASAVAAGWAHWALVLAAMFLTMGVHGITFPIVQSGAVAPFPRQAGTAAGLMGALYMLVAFAVGTVVGATHDGTLMPLSVISCLMGAALFVSVMLVRPPREAAA